MFRKIAVAYNESPEAERALHSAIQLAKRLGAELRTITVMSDNSAIAAYASIADPGLPRVLQMDRLKFYESLQERARRLAEEQGVDVTCHMIEGREVGSIVEFLRAHHADLLVVGLHQRDLYISRLWSTVYELAQEAPCSVLGVH